MIASYIPDLTNILEIVVLSPPGMINASISLICFLCLTVTAAPQTFISSKACFTDSMCSDTAPWIDKTPTVTISTSLFLARVAL